MHFIKMHGAGNDFVMLDLVANERPKGDLAQLARRACDRHKGVGADGLIMVSRGEKAPFKMEMLNPDGTDGGMCGNGVRCVGRLLVEEGHLPVKPFDLEVGERILKVEPCQVDQIRVNMAQAFLTRGQIGMAGNSTETFIDQPIKLDNECWPGTAVSMGNPHLVLFCDDPDAIDLERIGPRLEHHALFPNRVNVHFACKVGKDHLRMRTWERGAGITLACGSGACSVGVAGFLNGLTGRKARIDLPGGTLGIEYRVAGDVVMEGPAKRVFAGDL